MIPRMSVPKNFYQKYYSVTARNLPGGFCVSYHNETFRGKKMDEQQCREAVYSNVWYDLILRKDDVIDEMTEDECLMKLDGA